MVLPTFDSISSSLSSLKFCIKILLVDSGDKLLCNVVKLLYRVFQVICEINRTLSKSNPPANPLLSSIHVIHVVKNLNIQYRSTLDPWNEPLLSLLYLWTFSKTLSRTNFAKRFFEWFVRKQRLFKHWKKVTGGVANKNLATAVRA